jgi:hypothetical protein
MSLEEILGGVWLAGYLMTLLVAVLFWNYRGGWNAGAQVAFVGVFWPVIVLSLLLGLLWKWLKRLFQLG